MRTKTSPPPEMIAPIHTQLKVTNPIFGHMQPIPKQYTRDGANINPQLDIDRVPPTARSLAVIMEDADSGTSNWVHWVSWNIPVIRSIREARRMENQGINDFHESYYDGPCPPYGTHRYFFKVYALDNTLNLPANTEARELEEAMHGHIVGYGELAGTYRRR